MSALNMTTEARHWRSPVRQLRGLLTPDLIEAQQRAEWRAASLSAPFHPSIHLSSKDHIMQNYIVTLHVSAEGDIDADRIQQEIYDACAEVPFGFDVVSVSEEV